MPGYRLAFFVSAPLLAITALQPVISRAQTRGPGAVGYTAAERREIDQRLSRLAAEYGLTTRAIEAAIPGLNIQKFDIRRADHRELLTTRLSALANLRHGFFDVLDRSTIISSEPILKQTAKNAASAFDTGDIDGSIGKLLSLHDLLLTRPDGRNDYRKITYLIAALYRASGRHSLADEFIGTCESNAAWAESKEKWSSITCSTYADISRATSNGNIDEIRSSLENLENIANLYERASLSNSLPWEIERDLFNAAIVKMVFDAPGQSNHDLLKLGERLLSSYPGSKSDEAYVDLLANLAMLYGFSSNFGAFPENYHRAQSLISQASPPTSASPFFRYRVARAECAVRSAKYSQGLGPDTLAIAACQNALKIAEDNKFSADCIVDAQLLALESYIVLDGAPLNKDMQEEIGALIGKIFEEKDKWDLQWSPLRSALFEFLIARHQMRSLDRLPAFIANISISRMQSIDSNFANSQALLFSGGSGPQWQNWGISYVVHQMQVNSRTAYLSFDGDPPPNWPSAIERRDRAIEILQLMRNAYGERLPPRMDALFEFFDSSLAVRGPDQNRSEIFGRIKIHEERISRNIEIESDLHIFDRITILLLLTTLKEWGEDINPDSVKLHLSIIKDWESGEKANEISVPQGLSSWVEKTFNLSEKGGSIEAGPWPEES